MQVRPAKPEDAPGIALVHVRGWQIAYIPFFTEGFLSQLSVEERTGRWRHLLEGAATFQTLVAEENGRVVGFAGLGRSAEDLGDDVGELNGLYVDPDFWGRGIGSALLKTAEAGMREAGFERAVLWSIGAYERTRTFYERRGWQPDGATKPHKAGPELVRLARALAPPTETV